MGKMPDGRLGLWTGKKIPYDGTKIYFRNILAAPSGLFDLAAPILEHLDLERGNSRSH